MQKPVIRVYRRRIRVSDNAGRMRPAWYYSFEDYGGRETSFAFDWRSTHRYLKQRFPEAHLLKCW